MAKSRCHVPKCPEEREASMVFMNGMPSGKEQHDSGENDGDDETPFTKKAKL